MKTTHTLTLGLIGADNSLYRCLCNSAVIPGDTFVINFTATGETVGGNWNEVVATLNLPIAAGTLLANLKNFADGTERTGVNLAITAPEDTFGLGGRNEAPDAARIFPVSGVIPDAAQRRLTYHTTAGQEFIFSGLDDNLTYNLSILSANTAGRTDQVWIANPGPGQTSISVDPDDGLVHTFFNLSTNGAGTIILQSSAAGSGTDAQHLNAMELTAIPEPSTYAAIMGLVVIGVMFLRRRRAS
ncbi:MAG: PEP-CTERM sorting domain-containing protein [Verrucomicrobia bacterium]|nr:PEP-CTERM sorting domain-containing protein [Verrucomicrobiota bacterium]